MYNTRHEQILQALIEGKERSVTFLAELTGVSEVTIRKDLTNLEHTGCLLRTRGGATLAENFRMIRSMRIRQQQQRFVKQAIARSAAALIEPDEVVYIDAGSTCQLAAQFLINHDIRVITNSIDVLSVLSGSETVSLSILGGNLRRSTGAMIGPAAEQILKRYQFTTAFIGATAFSREGRFSSDNILESELKHMALSQARRSVVITDSSKYLQQAFSVFAQSDDVDLMITDSGFPDTDHFLDLGITLQIVS